MYQLVANIRCEWREKSKPANSDQGSGEDENEKGEIEKKQHEKTMETVCKQV